MWPRWKIQPPGRPRVGGQLSPPLAKEIRSSSEALFERVGQARHDCLGRAFDGTKRARGGAASSEPLAGGLPTREPRKRRGR